MVPEDDWRRMGQEAYLAGARLLYVRQYQPRRPEWDHEHCVFCWEKIAAEEGCRHSGYCTLDGKHWICETCVLDFQEEFAFQVES